MDFAKDFDKVGHRQFQVREDEVLWCRGKTNNDNVLGPCVFLFYINDMPEGLHQETTFRLFADDTVAYLAVTNNQDVENLQEDLTKLEKWE